ncbi:MAG: hypothetical protein F3741_11890 [Nitrospinae bacterium]|nr:hypothetical protein [Nitrospinota bacterium]MZH42461.1 hypothetical protein [Nitrospinota bacterium]MZH46270.1 hypothetical protein [Nitrospinota bacterium]
MNSFVYKCEKCGYEIRLIVARLTDKKLSSKCFKCKDKRNFIFMRRGNVGDDWIIMPYHKKPNAEGINKS